MSVNPIIENSVAIRGTAGKNNNRRMAAGSECVARGFGLLLNDNVVGNVCLCICEDSCVASVYLRLDLIVVLC